VLVAQGKPVSEAVRSIAASEATYFRWRAEFGGLKLDRVERLRALERENARLRKAVAGLTLEKAVLEKAVLKEAASGSWQARPAAGGAPNT
jgi:putative transposase